MGGRVDLSAMLIGVERCALAQLRFAVLHNEPTGKADGLTRGLPASLVLVMEKGFDKRMAGRQANRQPTFVLASQIFT